MSLIPGCEQVQELVLRGQEIRAVERKQGIIFFDQLAARENKKLLDVALYAGHIIPVPLFVIRNNATRAKIEDERMFFDRGVRDTDLLLTFERHGKFSGSFG